MERAEHRTRLSAAVVALLLCGCGGEAFSPAPLDAGEEGTLPITPVPIVGIDATIDVASDASEANDSSMEEARTATNSDGAAEGGPADVGSDVVDALLPNGDSLPTCAANAGKRCGCDDSGTVGCDFKCSSPDDTCTPMGLYYVLTNEFLGIGRPLDTYGTPPNDPFVATMTGFSGQNWKIVALGDGTYRLSNMFLGDVRALATAPDGSKLLMAATSADPAQRWRIHAVGQGYFRLSSVLLGEAQSLDTKNDNINEPFMAPTGDFSGQYWRFTMSP